MSGFGLLLFACQSNAVNESGTNSSSSSSSSDKNDTPPIKQSNYTKCKDPRPEMCTREYRPVCAKRDTGVRCVTTPCSSTELVTKPTGCAACSDKKVFGYTLGACLSN